MRRFMHGTAVALTVLSFWVAAPAAAAPVSDISVAGVITATLHRGDEGPAVRQLQTRLYQLHYYPGGIDGSYGYLTQQAVLAFQKVNGLQRDGVAGPATLTALEHPIRPRARATASVALEVVKGKQVVLLTRFGAVKWIFNASTGTASTPTPSGLFTVYRQINGWRTSTLGRLYRPKYFLRGYAVHGSTSVPAYPASHGCVRINLAAADFVWGRVPVGSRVRIYDTLRR